MSMNFVRELERGKDRERERGKESFVNLFGTVGLHIKFACYQSRYISRNDATGQLKLLTLKKREKEI